MKKFFSFVVRLDRRLVAFRHQHPILDTLLGCSFFILLPCLYVYLVIHERPGIFACTCVDSICVHDCASVFGFLIGCAVFQCSSLIEDCFSILRNRKEVTE